MTEGERSQTVSLRTFNPLVTSSNLVRPTNKIKGLADEAKPFFVVASDKLPTARILVGLGQLMHDLIDHDQSSQSEEDRTNSRRPRVRRPEVHCLLLDLG